jgi:hypothetical protein
MSRIGAGIVAALTAQLTIRNKEDHNASGCDDDMHQNSVCENWKYEWPRMGDALYG